MRRVHFLLILAAGIMVLPNLTWSQGPGSGFGPREFKMPDPNAMFDRIAKGKEEIIVSELDPQQQMMIKMIGSRFGLTGDRITRQQFIESQEKAKSMFEGMMKGGPQPPFASVGGGSGGEDKSDLRPKGEKGGGRDNAQFTDQRAEFFFRQGDKDNDGLLSATEMSETLLRERETWDTNKDGYIDLNEYKAYLANRNKKPEDAAPAKTDTPKQPDAKNQPPVAPDSRQPIKENPAEPFYRAGKFPPGIPDWFIKMDREGDNDGQVGMYEWKKSTRSIDEFLSMDMNGDGLITPDEVLRFTAKKTGKDSKGDLVAASEDRPSNRGNGGGGGGRGPGGGFGGQPGGGFGGQPGGGFGGQPGGGFGGGFGGQPGGGFGGQPGGGRFGQGGGGFFGQPPAGGGILGQPSGGIGGQPPSGGGGFFGQPGQGNRGGGRTGMIGGKDNGGIGGGNRPPGKDAGGGGFRKKG